MGLLKAIIKFVVYHKDSWAWTHAVPNACCACFNFKQIDNALLSNNMINYKVLR